MQSGDLTGLVILKHSSNLCFLSFPLQPSTSNISKSWIFGGFLLATLYSMWDLRSLNRDGTCSPWVKKHSLNHHLTTGEVQIFLGKSENTGLSDATAVLSSLLSNTTLILAAKIYNCKVPLQLQAATWRSYRQWDLNGRVLCHFQTHCLKGIDLLGKVPVCSPALPSFCCLDGCSGWSSGYHLGLWEDGSYAHRIIGWKDQADGDFPASPVVKTSCSQCREHRSSQGTKFLHAAQHSWKKEKEGRQTDQTESDGIVELPFQLCSGYLQISLSWERNKLLSCLKCY